MGEACSCTSMQRRVAGCCGQDQGLHISQLLVLHHQPGSRAADWVWVLSQLYLLFLKLLVSAWKALSCLVEQCGRPDGLVAPDCIWRAALAAILQHLGIHLPIRAPPGSMSWETSCLGKFWGLMVLIEAFVFLAFPECLLAAAWGGGCALTCSAIWAWAALFQQKEIVPRRVGADGSLPLLVACSFSALGEESRNKGNNFVLLIKQQLWTSALEMSILLREKVRGEPWLTWCAFGTWK